MRLRRQWLQGLLMLVLGCAGGALAQVPESSLNEEVVTIPLPSSARWPNLVATIFRPAGEGPFPVIVMNHGSPGTAAERARMGRYRALRGSQEFVQRGFMVVLPMRRGYGDTGGPWAEHYASCASPNFSAAGDQAAIDLLATIDYLRALPYANTEQIMLVGQSAGGFAALAAASHNPPGVMAVVNFSGGRGGNPRTRPGEPCGIEQMTETMARFGQTIRVPVLWHYAENDQFFGPVVVRRWFEAFEAAGAPGRLVMQPPFGRDGHGMFGAASGVAIWVPIIENFMREAGFAPRGKL